jgi:hypothetical protein
MDVHYRARAAAAQRARRPGMARLRARPAPPARSGRVLGGKSGPVYVLKQGDLGGIAVVRAS